MGTETATLVRVLARLGVGQIVRLRRSGPSGTVEVHARIDGALEVPAAVIATGEEGGSAPEGPHVLFGRHRIEELAARLVAAIDDLELVTSSIVDASGVERLLDGSGARTATNADGLLDRWDLPLIEQVRRYLSQRFALPLSELTSGWQNIIFVPQGRIPYAVQTLTGPPRILVSATIVHRVAGSAQLDLALHRLSTHAGLVRLRHRRSRVLAEVVLPAPTFMGQHLDVAISEIRRVSTAVSDGIAAEFGGDVSYRLRYLPQLSDVVDPDETDTAGTTDPTRTTDTDEQKEDSP